MAQRLVSVNVGLPRTVASDGKEVTTGIFKHPVEGRVWARRHNLDGDGQADLSAHGGPEKAVYAYPSEHYAWWREELEGLDLPFGAFGENLTTEGLFEEDLHVGDRLRVGAAAFVVTQPRMPCYKLGIRFGRADIVKRFLESGRPGFYLSVLEEGELGRGDPVEVEARVEGGITVVDVVRLYLDKRPDREMLRRAVGAEALPEGWRRYFREKLGEDA